MIEAAGAMDPFRLSGDAQALQEKALELAADDQVMAMRLLEMIALTNRTTLASLQAGSGASSWDDVAGAAHRIAGSARLLANGELITLLTELEAAAREQRHAEAGVLLRLVVDAVVQLNLSIDAAVSGITRR
jgi:HPt (histidine-containing phosphotransfer) domain-containing protein